jgi:hypothetical protein
MNMRRIALIGFLMIGLIFAGCKTIEKTTEITEYQDSLVITPSVPLEISFLKGDSYNHPTFVIWEETMDGTYQKTLFITESYARGIFDYQMIGDSVWMNKSGSSYQPAALPYWTYKKGPLPNQELVPTTDFPYVDAYTGETPKGDFTYKTGIESVNSERKIMVEVNQAWDWNRYWTNNKFPDSPAYKHSAQPSVIYSGTITGTDTVVNLSPVGHGDPTGKSGELFKDLSTLTTAKEIFKSIKIKIIR